MVGLIFGSIFYMARVKAYIYRYDFFVPILQLSTVATLTDISSISFRYQINQSMPMKLYFCYLLALSCFIPIYSNILKTDQTQTQKQTQLIQSYLNK